MLDFGAGATHGSVEDTLVRSTARPGACQELLCGGFGEHDCVLFDAAPLRPMHGRSGAAGRTCFDGKPSVGTCVLSSVSAFGGYSFGSRWACNTSRPGPGGRARAPGTRVMQGPSHPPCGAGGRGLG
eukprot:216127-Prymnesium_polylepis.1